MAAPKRRPWRIELRVSSAEERTIRAAARAAGKSCAEFVRSVALGSKPRATHADLDKIDALIALREAQRDLLGQLGQLGQLSPVPGGADGAAVPGQSPASGTARSSLQRPAAAGRSGMDSGLAQLRRQVEHQVARMGEVLEAAARALL
jgi:uncharacterized protein (DUF1778 family)